MTINEEKPKSLWAAKLEEVLGIDLRSLAVFRMGLALAVMADLFMRSQALTAHYTDEGVLPRSVLRSIDNPWYWSIDYLSGQPIIIGILFIFSFLVALALLIGYRTRIAIIITWAMIISIQNRNPALIFAADHALRAILFWSMFLPLGACYSVDSALNTSTKPLPKRVVSAATFAFMVQLGYIYIWSAAFKATSPDWWETGEAVYYALSFDQYVTPFGNWLLNFQLPLLNGFTRITLVFEWVGPLIIFIPWRNGFFRCVAIISFILLHIGFGISFFIGILSYLCVFAWLALLPSSVWDSLQRRLDTPQRRGLAIYYDADCGFCKKVVYLIRTFAILPGTPLNLAQDDASIYESMQANNSWVVVDWEGNRHFKFEAIAYVCSLSPLLFLLAPVFRWPPIMAVGTKFYQAIANNRSFAGNFTKPFQFKPLEVSSSLWLNIITLVLLALTTLWNLTSFVTQTTQEQGKDKKNWISATNQLLHRKTFNQIAIIGYLTRLDQIWSIFAPGPPRDDGWHIIKGKLKDGTEVSPFQGDKAFSEQKPTLQQRYDFYPSQQWRVYFINLNRGIGKATRSYFGYYLCQQWNAKHQGDKRLESVEVFLMDERTPPPGQPQEIRKKKLFETSCPD